MIWNRRVRTNKCLANIGLLLFKTNMNATSVEQMRAFLVHFCAL